MYRFGCATFNWVLRVYAMKVTIARFSAFFSIFGSYLMVYMYDWERVSTGGLLQGYNWFIWCCVFQQVRESHCECT